MFATEVLLSHKYPIMNFTTYIVLKRRRNLQTYVLMCIWLTSWVETLTLQIIGILFSFIIHNRKTKQQTVREFWKTIRCPHNKRTLAYFYKELRFKNHAHAHVRKRAREQTPEETCCINVETEFYKCRLHSYLKAAVRTPNKTLNWWPWFSFDKTGV